MPAPHNPFKAAINKGELQVGCWLGLADAYIAEISASAGFDWVCVDGEHSPNDLRSIMAQLQVLKGSDTHAMVRPPGGDTALIKQYLDAGAQSLLIPMVESGAQAQAMVDDHSGQNQAPGVFAHSSQLCAFAGEEGCCRHVIERVGGLASEGLVAGSRDFLGDGQRALRGVLQRPPALARNFRRVGS